MALLSLMSPGRWFLWMKNLCIQNPITPLSALVGTLLGLVNLVFLVMLVLGIVNAANGRAKELPVIGKFKILK